MILIRHVLKYLKISKQDKDANRSIEAAEVYKLLQGPCMEYHIPVERSHCAGVEFIEGWL